jgi:hypothetical protein
MKYINEVYENRNRDYKMKYIFIDRSELDHGDNKNNGNSIEERASNGIDYIGKGICNFGKDLLRFVGFSCILYGAYFIGGVVERATYEREPYVPKILLIKEDEVFIDGKKSNLFYDEDLGKDQNEKVFVRKEDLIKNKESEQKKDSKN